MINRILIIDDEPLNLELLAAILTEEGYQIARAATASEALAHLTHQLFTAALVDIRMPETSGVDLLRQIKRHDPSIEVIMMTGYPEYRTAVEALKGGAYDYIQKPLNHHELRLCLKRVMAQRILQHEVTTLRKQVGQRLTGKELVGTSRPMTAIKAMIAQVAPTISSVLIEGESGTGKELIAAAIHRSSPRSHKPFIPVNCAAISTDLLESEFFGHAKGAFTGAIADSLGLFRSAEGGTLFLDEITELPLAVQSKLLRAVQEKEVRPVGSQGTVRVDVRVIAATNRDLAKALQNGTFREDLFYRLDVVRIKMPPLRERKSDIPMLVNHFLRQWNERFAREVETVSSEAMAVLMAHDFPGNVRELENILERAYALGATTTITREMLPSVFTGLPVFCSHENMNGPLRTLAEMERGLIVQAIRVHPNKEEAARALGLSPRTLYRRLKEYKLPH